jgi:streptogramin lyase
LDPTALSDWSVSLINHHLILMRLALVLTALFVAATSAHAAALSVFAGSGAKGFAGDGHAAVEAKLADPSGIAIGPDGSLYICDTANHRIRRVGRDGKITVVAGTGEKGWSGDGGPATAAKLAEPYEVRFDASENIFWVERLSHSVRRLDAKTGVITTIAGTGAPGFSGDGGLATRAQLNEPHSIAFDSAGDLYIADVKNHRIRKVTMKTGTITTLAGTGERKPTPDGAHFATAPLAGPRALAFDHSGGLWLALREGNAIYRLDLAQGTIHHVAGTGQKGDTGDGGPAREATLNGPKGIAVAPDGSVFVADTENHVIRRIDPVRGTIERFAGTGERGDGTSADPLTCKLNRPHGIFVADDGAVFIGDTEAQRVLRVVRSQ